jgi:FkbM family methyltransferase
MLNAVADETLTRRIYHDSRQHFEDGGWAMDAGACEGLLALEILRQGGKVVAVEPVSDLAHALERTLDPYIREGRALVVACALSDYNGEAPFQVMPDYVIGSGFSVSGEKEQRAGSGSYAVTVPVRTIDDLVSELGLARVSFIKADIEGAEVAMLRGAVHTLRTHRPQLAICAYHAPSDRLVIPQMLETFGYDWRFNAAIEVVLAWFGSP